MTPTPALEAEAPNTWKWKRLRDIAFTISFWPLRWRFGPWKQDDFYGGACGFGCGPVGFTFYYSATDGALSWLVGPRCEMDVKP